MRRTLHVGQRFALAAALLSCLLGAGCDRLEEGSAGTAVDPPQQEVGPRVQRVVLVTIDTLRADRVGSQIDGQPVTPRMDALARSGTRFANAISPVPVTMPSHATIMTGLQPTRHGVRANGSFTLSNEIPTLATRFRAGGFATGAFVGAVVLGGHYGLAQGFDRYDDEMGTRRALGKVGYPERRASAVVNRAIEWLEGAPDQFFLWTHFYDPHMAHQPPPNQRLMFPNDLYAAEIHFADEQLGRLVDMVHARFGEEGTLVVVTSDHGESFGEHGESSHSYTLYDATQRVPLLLMGPDVPADQMISDVVRLADIAPTVLAAVGLAADDGLDGRDLAPLLRGETEEPRVAWVETVATRIEQGWSPVYGVRTQRFKYLRAPRPELYAVEQDPDELVDLASKLPDVMAMFEAQIDDVLVSQRPIRMNGEMDPEERLQLQALGYVIPAGSKLDESDFEVGGTDPKDAIGGLVGLSRALALALEGDYAGALTALEAVPGSGGHILTYRSRYARLSGDPALAERYARQAVEEAPAWDAAHLELAAALVARGDLEGGRAALLRAAQLDPQNPTARLALGTLAMTAGDLDAAVMHLELAVAGHTHVHEAHWRLAAIRFAEGRNAEAEALLAEIPPAMQWHPQVVTNLVAGLARSNQPKAARRRAQLALRRRPQSAPLRKLLRALDEELAAAQDVGDPTSADLP